MPELSDMPYAAGIGATYGFMTGGFPGAVVGGLEGALSVLAGLGATSAARGLGLSDKSAEAIGRVTELLTPMGAVGEASGAGKFLANVLDKTPNALKIGFKASMAAASLGYIAEPYTSGEDGEEYPVGLAALAAGSYLLAHKFKPLAQYAIYTARRNIAAASKTQRVPDVLFDNAEKIVKYGLELPKVERGENFTKSLINPFAELDVHVKAQDILPSALTYRKLMVMEEEHRLKSALDSFLKIGIKPGSDLSRHLGTNLFPNFKSILKNLKSTFELKSLSSIKLNFKKFFLSIYFFSNLSIK